MTRVLPLSALAVFGALACFPGPYGRVTEVVSSAVPGDSIRVIVVVAGESEDTDLRIAAQVRDQLNAAGLTALRRPGLWDSEQSALAEICPRDQPSDVDGVLFVWWNQLELRECPTHRPAYQIRGGYTGVNAMVKRLLRYLRVTPAG
ncbi:MAG TPA: hypothetical protein VNI61_02845 [Gemmatimonadales bacterium]|nr:hypothetical protein [Gemmatimonadales bacterium]